MIIGRGWGGFRDLPGLGIIMRISFGVGLWNYISIWYSFSLVGGVGGWRRGGLFSFMSFGRTEEMGVSRSFSYSLVVVDDGGWLVACLAT